MPVIIAIFIFLASHLTVDRDFSHNVKIASTVVFSIIGAIYVIFGLAI